MLWRTRSRSSGCVICSREKRLYSEFIRTIASQFAIAVAHEMQWSIAHRWRSENHALKVIDQHPGKTRWLSMVFQLDSACRGWMG